MTRKKYIFFILIVILVSLLFLSVYRFIHSGPWYSYEDFEFTSELRMDITSIKDTLRHHEFEGFISIAGDSLYLNKNKSPRIPFEFIKEKMDDSKLKGVFVGKGFIFFLLSGGNFFDHSYGVLYTERSPSDLVFIRKSRLLLNDSNSVNWHFVEAAL